MNSQISDRVHSSSPSAWLSDVHITSRTQSNQHILSHTVACIVSNNIISLLYIFTGNLPQLVKSVLFSQLYICNILDILMSLHAHKHLKVRTLDEDVHYPVTATCSSNLITYVTYVYVCKMLYTKYQKLRKVGFSMLEQYKTTTAAQY